MSIWNWIKSRWYKLREPSILVIGRRVDGLTFRIDLSQLNEEDLVFLGETVSQIFTTEGLSILGSAINNYVQVTGDEERCMFLIDVIADNTSENMVVKPSEVLRRYAQ